MEALVVAPPGPAGTNAAPESSKSAVSWPAIIAGAVAATAASVLLLTLGSGLGLISASPGPGSGASAGRIMALAAIWFIVVQWIASFLGGYLTAGCVPNGLARTPMKCSFATPLTASSPGHGDTHLRAPICCGERHACENGGSRCRHDRRRRGE